MTTAYVWKKRGIVRLGVFLGLALLSGCATELPYRRPCVVTGLTINLLSDAAADTYCQDVRHVTQDQSGDKIKAEAGQGVMGCASKKEIVVGQTDSLDTLVHELRHVLDANCGTQKAH